jgi:large subunit ribosomal protein L17
MKHHDKNKKLGRERKARTALKRSLVRALLLRESIETTEAKAKTLRPVVEKLVTQSKIDTLSRRRAVAAILSGDRKLVAKLFVEIGPRYSDRAGGYTRIVRTSKGGDDARQNALIQFV